MEEYPELRAEVEEELKKLEAEKDARLAEVEMLEKELEKAKEAAEERSTSSSGPAFIPSSPETDNETEESGPETDDKTEETGADDFEIIDDGDSTAQAKNDVPLVDEDEIVMEKEVIQDVKTATTELTTKNESDEDFTMKAITFEVIRTMVKQLESNIKVIVELVTPAIRPILRAGDVAWRHLRVAVELLRNHYEKSKAGEEETVEEAVSS